MSVKVDGQDVFLASGTKEYSNSKQSIVCLHGSGLDHTCWLALLNKLENENYNLIIPDFPGHGCSDGHSLRSITEQSEWLDKLLQTLECESPIIIGHSQGGLVALNYCCNLNNVQKLILVNSSSKISVHPDLINLAKQNDEKAVDLMLKWAYTGHEKNYTTERVARKIIMSRTLSQTLAVDFMACNNYQIDEEHIKKIRVPTLIISSENDKMIPSSLSSELQKIIENSEIKTMENTGHMAILEEFSKVGDLIGSFLSKA